VELYAQVTTELADVLPVRHQQVKTYVSPAGVTIAADPAKLHDVLGNLVQNAVHYAFGHDTITLSADADGEERVLTVEDSGPGIPDVDLRRVFERFYRSTARALAILAARGSASPSSNTWCSSTAGRSTLLTDPVAAPYG
jgi:signal transduction histidine kinase